MITVNISKQQLRDFGADIHSAIHTLEALKKAGIPVVGYLLPMTVSEGVLTMRDDAMLDTVTWTWDGELEDLA